jgi:hypothetical protein
MEALRRRLLIPVAVLLCGLVLLSSAERRLAYLDFESGQNVRFENNDRPDGDEIIQRLVVVDDATQPIVPNADEAYFQALISIEFRPRSLIVVRLSESRAPPLVLSPLV